MTVHFDHATFADALLEEIPSVQSLTLHGSPTEREITLAFARLLLRPFVLAVPAHERAGLLTDPPADAVAILVEKTRAVVPSGVDLAALCRTHAITWADLGFAAEAA